MKKLQVTVADVQNLTPAYRRFWKGSDLYELTPEARIYSCNNYLDILERLGRLIKRQKGLKD